jgi:hypothetical protein
MFKHSAQRGLAMGMKYGLVKGFRAYHSEEATPEMDETAMQGAIGIIIAVGGVLIALYIIAVVVGSISYAVTSGNIKLSPTWNATITNIDSSAQATFNLAKPTKSGQHEDKDIRSSFNGLFRRGPCVTDSNHRGGYPYDRHWCICRSGGIISQARVESGWEYPHPFVDRTLNTAIA